MAGIAPEEPKNGDYWMDTSVKPHVLKQFSSSSGMWASVPTVYVKIASSGLGKNFEQYDGVTISGCEDESFNGDFIVFDRGEDYLLVTAVLDMAFTQDRRADGEAARAGHGLCVRAEQPGFGAARRNSMRSTRAALGNPKIGTALWAPPRTVTP